MGHHICLCFSPETGPIQRSRSPLDFLPACAWFVHMLDLTCPVPHPCTLVQHPCTSLLWFSIAPLTVSGLELIVVQLLQLLVSSMSFASSPNNVQQNLNPACNAIHAIDWKPGSINLASFPSQINQTMGKQHLKETQVNKSLVKPLT